MSALALVAAKDDLDNTIDPTAYSNLDTVQVASLLVGVFIPILVALVTKRTTSSTVKSLLLLGLSAVSGFLTEYINSANFRWQQALMTTIVTFVIGVATHYGLWTPTGVRDKAQASLVKDTPPRPDGGHTDVRLTVMAAAVGLILAGAALIVLWYWQAGLLTLWPQ